MIEPIRILKGHTGAVDVGTWENSGRVLVSVQSLVLDPYRPGEYVRRKGGFACSADEAREIAEALTSVATAVDGSPPRSESVDDQLR